MNKSSSGIAFVGILMALASAIYLSYNVVLPGFADAGRAKVLANNCANPGWPEEGEKNTVFDPEKGEVSVTFYKNGRDVTVVLPYKPSTDFEGCSSAAKAVLSDVKINYDEYIAQSCADFKSILEGKTPMTAKNGEKPNIEGAKQFVKEYCQ